MKKQFDELISNSLEAESTNINLSDLQRQTILQNIHIEKNRRSIKMISKKNRVLIIAAAIVVFGAMTAVAAGKVVGYHSSSSSDQVDYANAADLKNAKAQLGAVPKAPQQFSNGKTFGKGKFVIVEGMDENGTVIETIPTVTIDYDDIYLRVEKPRAAADFEDIKPIKSTEVNGVILNAHADNYLFLPPDATPSDEDLALEAAGELYISYGSSEEERDTYTYVTWDQDGLNYLLSTFSTDYSIEQLMTMAEEVVLLSE